MTEARRQVLIACEIGPQARSLVRIGPVAAGLVSRGYTVTVALPDPADTGALAALQGCNVVQGSAWQIPPPPGAIASCYADLLLNSGYVTADALRGVVGGWIAICRAVEPDLLIADCAPSALLAARVLGIKAAALGDGYAIPPATTPMPTMRPWAALRPGQIEEPEFRVLAVINAVMSSMRSPPLPVLAELFRTEATFLCAFPELDHYAGRIEALRYGEVYAVQKGQTPDWPPGTAERVLVAVSRQHPAFEALLQALKTLGLPSLIQTSGVAVAPAGAISPGSIRIVEQPLDQAAALADCDIVVCQTAAVTAPALLAGKPVLLMPRPVEQMMILHRIASQGLGQGVEATADSATVAAALRRLLDDAPIRRTVANFARSYAGYAPGMATEAIIDACVDLLA